MDSGNYYDELWNQSLLKFKADHFVYDSLIDSADDKRYGISLFLSG